jgi:hypothetical protein
VDELVTSVAKLKSDGVDVSIYDFTSQSTTALNGLNGYISAGCDNLGPSTSSKQYNKIECYSAVADTSTCAPDADHSGCTNFADIQNARNALVTTMWTSNVCAGTLLDTFVSSSQSVKSAVDTLSASMNSLQTAIGGAKDSMVPVQDNINVLKAAGSCIFIRRRFNGILKGLCGDTLQGVSTMGWMLLVIGVALYVFYMVLNHCAIPRFRMYDVACWHHDRTQGCCPKSSDDDEDDASNIEMVHKYSSGTNSRAVVV